jgi:hypothetical protein
MEIDVVVPSIRPAGLQWVVDSLSRNRRRPDLVTIVTNELNRDLECRGLNVRVLSFSSGQYPVGCCDLALRRNLGVWLSPCEHVMLFDDDQVAPEGLIESALERLADRPYCWGHHRFLSFEQHTLDEILRLAPEAGRPREHPPNAWHGYLSCYGGLFAARRDVVIEVGGFDLVFLGRCANEDQSFGRRLALHVDGDDRVFVHEPPFAWHPEGRLPCPPPGYTNICASDHDLEDAEVGGVAMVRCRRCPYHRHNDSQETLFGDGVVMAFDPDKVDVRIGNSARGSSSTGG